MRRILPILVFSLLTACAAIEKKGILVNVEPATPMDESDLRQHCDLGDSAACALASLHNTPLPDPRFPIVQGLAPSDRAIFSALVPKGSAISWFVYDSSTMLLTKLFTEKPVIRGDGPWAVQRLDVRGLLPGRGYDLLAGDAEGRLLDDRKFRTLATDESRLRAAIAGGWRFASPLQHSQWLARQQAEQPQLLVFAGSVYEASLPPKLLTDHHREAADFYFTRQTLAFSRFEPALSRNLLPAMDLWNDDEFGQPDGDRSFGPKEQAREQLDLFFPHWADLSSVVAGPGVSVLVPFRRAAVAFMDDLSFRRAPTPGTPACYRAKKSHRETCRPGKSIPAPVGTRYGGLEKDWVADRAAKSPLPFWVLAGGRTLQRFRPDWVDQAALNSPNLSQPPGAFWTATIEGDSNGELRIVDENR